MASTSTDLTSNNMYSINEEMSAEGIADLATGPEKPSAELLKTWLGASADALGIENPLMSSTEVEELLNVMLDMYHIRLSQREFPHIQ